MPAPRFVDPSTSRLRRAELGFVIAPESTGDVAPPVLDGELRAKAQEPAPPSPGGAVASEPLVIEAELIRTILEPLDLGETAAAGYARKEAAVIALLEALVPADAWALHDRLASPRTADALATAFARLSAERRARMLGYLRDAPRRDLLRNAQRHR